MSMGSAHKILNTFPILNFDVFWTLNSRRFSISSLAICKTYEHQEGVPGRAYFEPRSYRLVEPMKSGQLLDRNKIAFGMTMN
jgi:hypothetical protein